MHPMKRVRVLQDLTQKELAERAGVARQTINNIEHGRTRGQEGKLRRIADALGVTIEDINPKVPAPLLEFSYEQRRTLLGLLASKHLPPVPGGDDLRDLMELSKEAPSKGMTRQEFKQWFLETDVDDVREDLLPEEAGATLEEELAKS